eukprot:9523061-Lingulodinium_polyedra.AAC.1
MSPRLRDGERHCEEVRQRTITVAMGNGVQAMQLTEVHSVTDSTNALQSMAEPQQLRANVDEVSKELMSYATVTTASVKELHQNMASNC